MPDRHDVALVYAPPWRGPTRFSKHHLAEYLARGGHRVLYIEAPLSPLGVRRGRAFFDELQTTLRPPRCVGPNLWVRRHFLPIPYHAITRLTSQRAANRVGQRLLAPAIRRDLLRLGFVDPPILIAGLPHAVDALPGLPRRCLVYHCADDYASVSGFPASLPQLEAELCRTADLVVTTSETLCLARRVHNPNTHWIPNGVEFEHLAAARSAEPAPDLRELPPPVVGFVGGLSEWVDLELVGCLARQRPGWSFALVGPAGTRLDPVRGLPNVHLLGARPYAELPAYLAGMHVGLIPFKRNAVTYHADPIKAYEYLAAGLPVVAADLPALRRLRHVVRVADSPQAFLAELDAAVEAGREAGRAERQREAAQHSWTARFLEFERLLGRCSP